MKSKVYALMALVCTVVVFGSCSMVGEEKEKTYSYVQAVAFKYEKGGEYGMMNLNGEVIVEPRFENEPTEASCDRFFAQDDDGLWELYTLEANPKLVNDEKYSDVGAFVDGLCPVTQENSWPMYIDTEGTVVFEAKEYNGKNIIKARNFQDGMAAFQTEDDLYGFFNEYGEVVVAPQYYMANDFYDGKTIVYKPMKPGKDEDSREWAVINKNGQELFSTKLSRMKPTLDGFENDLTLVSSKNGNKYQLINSKGEQVHTLNDVNSTHEMWDGLINYEDEDYYEGIMDIEGNVVISPEYKNITWHGGPVVAYDNDESEFYILGKKGEVLNSFEAYKLWVPTNKYIGYKDRLLFYPDTTQGYFLDGQGNKLESSIIFRTASGESMGLSATDYNLGELFAEKLMMTKDGLLGVKVNDDLSEIDDTNVFWRNGDVDEEDDNKTAILKGSYLGCDYKIYIMFTGDIFDKDTRVRSIVAVIDMPHRHIDKFREAVTKKVEQLAKFFKKMEMFGSQGKAYLVNGKNVGYFISDGKDDALVIYFGE